MPLASGTRLGPYEIIEPLGAGGMGEVYRAQDTRLGRVVALKTSHEQFSERFAREARAVAALNHANICHLYDVGPDYLVMELADGDELKGPLEFDRALPIIRQLVDGIDAAHEKNIVHRDLKPANIKITHDGVVKILDFGLARAADPEVDADPRNSPTMTVGATGAGVILGTAAYMSPEQARGKTADRRSDIWSFGAVVYEPVTGRPAFGGEGVIDTLSAVLNKEPDWTAVPPRALPLLQWCLEKDRKRRLQAIGDARWLLEHTTAAPTPIAFPRARRWPFAAAAAAIALVAGAAGGWLMKRAPEQPLLQMEITAPAGVRLGRVGVGQLALSRDGSRLVYVAAGPDGKRMLWLRPLDQSSAVVLAGTEYAGWPFWSPDGRWIGFSSSGQLKKIPAAGGTPLTICDANPNDPPTWGAQDVILYKDNSHPQILRVSANGGSPSPAVALDAGRKETSQQAPSFLPDGQRFVYGTNSAEPGTAIASLDGSLRRALFPARVAPPTFASDSSGHTWILSGGFDGQLTARPFDPRTSAITGNAVVVASSVSRGPSWSVSANGVLAFRRIQPLQTQLTWFDRDGKTVGTIGEPGAVDYPRISPDEKTVVFVRLDGPLSSNLWLFDVVRGSASRFTFGPGQQTLPIWSQDSRSIVYQSAPNPTFPIAVVSGDVSVVERPVGGIGQERVVSTGRSNLVASSLYGRWLVLRERNQRLILIPSSGGGKPMVLVDGDSAAGGEISPDGRWLLYSAQLSGRREIFVQPLPPEAGGPGGSAKWQISNAGGFEATWRADGREILYVAADGTMNAVAVDAGADFFRPGVPTPLFRTQLNATASLTRQFGVTADGRRFIVNQPVGDEGSDVPITVIVNWPRLLEK